jgi:hypothetical protein
MLYNQSHDPSSQYQAAVIFVITNEALLEKQHNIVPLKCTFFLLKEIPCPCNGYIKLNGSLATV